MTTKARQFTPAAIFLAGAVAYGLTVGTDAITFDATPLFIGLVAITAGAVGSRARLVAVGLPLVGWGAVVVLVRHGPIPDGREAAAFLVGASLGLVVADRWCRRTRLPLIGSIVTAVLGGLSFYLAFDVDVLNDWEWWVGALVVWASVEAVRTNRSG